MDHDTRSLLLISLACVGGAGVLAVALLRVVRRRSLWLSLLVAALAPMVGVVVAVLVSVRRMYLSHHDSKVSLITVLCSAVLACLLSVWLGLRVAGESRLLGAQMSTLAESRDRERALEASRRELVAFMSHDLRTPLAGLRALAEGLEDGVIDDEAAALARMRTTVERMSTLVDDLFELSRLSAGAPPRQLMSVSVTELADDVAALLNDLAGTRSVSVVVDAPADDRLRVTGDSDELARALTNLVANGLRHTDAGGTVRLVAGRDSHGRVRVAVVDGCGGIDEADLPRLFEVGWRGSPDRTPDDGGAGLGLAIARGVVEAHDGTISVANVPGGCRFEVLLPAGASPTA